MRKEEGLEEGKKSELALVLVENIRRKKSSKKKIGGRMKSDSGFGQLWELCVRAAVGVAELKREERVVVGILISYLKKR